MGKKRKKNGLLELIFGPVGALLILSILLYYTITLLVPIVIFAFVSAFGLYGTVFAIVSASLTYTSSDYRVWLQTRDGYARRLSWLPGLSSDSPRTLAVATLIYLLPISLFSLSLVVKWSIDNKTRTIDQELFLVGLGLGLITFISLFGWLVQGLGLVRRYRKFPSARSVNNYRLFEHIPELEELRSLNPTDFEHFIAGLFERMGYSVEPTAATGDEGVDLFLKRENKTAIVQCKRYRNNVGQPIVRDLYGTMQHNRVEEAYLVTTGTITLPAQEWARDKPIHLVDGRALVEWIRRLEQNPQKLNEQPRTKGNGIQTFRTAVLAFIGASLIEGVSIAIIYGVNVDHLKAAPSEVENNSEVDTTLDPNYDQTSTIVSTSLLSNGSTNDQLPARTPSAANISTKTPTNTKHPTATKTLTSTPLATSTPSPHTYYVKAAKPINARSCPKLSCEVITIFSPGQAIQVTEIVGGDMVSGSTKWHKALYNRLEVYVHSSLISKDPLPTPLK